MLNDRFVWPVRVYYEDTDAAGVVYHASYLRFMERARTEWLRALGFEHDVLLDEYNILFVVNQTNVSYVRAARFNEELSITSALERLRGASVEFKQIIEDRDGRTVCTADNRVACVDAASFKPRRIPGRMLRVFQGAD
jgi:acyl-CoA thioester hydrolase